MFVVGNVLVVLAVRGSRRWEMMVDSYLQVLNRNVHFCNTFLYPALGQEKKVPGTNQSKVYSSPSLYKGRPSSQRHFDSIRSSRSDYLEHIRLNRRRELIKMDTSKIFQGESDNYDGVTVTITEAMDAADFTEKLRASLSHWRQEVFKTKPSWRIWIMPDSWKSWVFFLLFIIHLQGKRGIWINLPILFANLVEAAVSVRGFYMKWFIIFTCFVFDFWFICLWGYIYMWCLCVWWLILQEGFRYHHAEPDYLMLVSWIANTPDTIPANASHVVGVGALVLNKNTGEVKKNKLFHSLHVL